MNNEEIRMILADRPMECSKCNSSLFYKGSGKYICRTCGNEEYDDFGKVKKYIDENGISTAGTIALDTGVSLEKINIMLREGKVEIPEGSDQYIECEKCGCSIRYGRYCPDCVRRTANDLKKAFYVEGMGEKPKMNGAMRYQKKEKKSTTSLNKENRKR